MKKTAPLMLAILIIGVVFASACIGGSTTSQTTSSPTLTTSSSSPGTTTTQGGTSSSQQSSTTTSTTTHTGSTSTQIETSTQTSSQTTTGTETETETTTVTETTTTTSTSTPTEKAYWSHPWEYAPVEVGGEKYWITYYKYDYKIQPNQSAPVYEYIVEKSVEKTKIHVYGQDMSGNKVDLGEKEVYAYKTVVTPVKGAAMDDKITFTLWFVSNESDAFLYPWNALWAQRYLSPAVQDKNFVGMKFEYKGNAFVFMNPAPFKSGLFPYFEGDSKPFEKIDNDLSYLYMGWAATLNFGIWYDWENYNLLVPQSGTWSDNLGHSWEWSTKPDGTVEYSGISFKLVDFTWKYKGTAEGVSMAGKGKVSPYLPLLVKGDGHYNYKDPKTGNILTIYAYLKLKDLKLQKVS
ncbi:hypothetical protein [Thermococcus sp.]